MLPALALALALHASTASAQTPSELAAARGLFEQGVAASTAHQWSEAIGLFERSYALAPRASTLLNLAGAQVETGQLVAASETYRRVVAEAGRSARDRQLRQQAETALGWLVPRLARVTLQVPGLAEGDVMTLDDVTIARGVVGTAIPVDPGAHVLVVRRAEREIGRARFELAEGESSEVNVVVRGAGPEVVQVVEDDPRTTVPDAAVTPDGGGGDDIVSSPWLWTVVGVVVVGGIVAAVVATTVNTSPTYYAGNLGDGQIRF